MKTIGHITALPGRIATRYGQARAAEAAASIRRRARLAVGDPEFLKRAVRLALWLIAVLVVLADAAAFAGSYLGLYQWAANHGMAGWRAYAFPLMVDTFVAVGELALFVSAARLWTFRTRVGGWTVALIGLAASIAGNVAHAPSAEWQTRLTWAVPPVAAAAALAVGLGILKNIARERRRPATWSAPALRTSESFGFVPPEEARPVYEAVGGGGGVGPSPGYSTGGPGGPSIRLVPNGTRTRITDDGPQAHRARMWIAEERLAGNEPSIREVAARWLGGDANSGPAWDGGNKRMAKRLLDENGGSS
jgi:hypothetical protein